MSLRDLKEGLCSLTKSDIKGMVNSKSIAHVYKNMIADSLIDINSDGIHVAFKNATCSFYLDFARFKFDNGDCFIFKTMLPIALLMEQIGVSCQIVNPNVWMAVPIQE